MLGSSVLLELLEFARIHGVLEYLLLKKSKYLTSTVLICIIQGSTVVCLQFGSLK